MKAIVYHNYGSPDVLGPYNYMERGVAQCLKKYLHYVSI
jgi:hypothetical protein